MFHTLSKFSESHTLQQGIEELKKLMRTDIKDSERMVIFLTKLTDFNEHIKV